MVTLRWHIPSLPKMSTTYLRSCQNSTRICLSWMCTGGARDIDVIHTIYARVAGKFGPHLLYRYIFFLKNQKTDAYVFDLQWYIRHLVGQQNTSYREDPGSSRINYIWAHACQPQVFMPQKDYIHTCDTKMAHTPSLPKIPATCLRSHQDSTRICLLWMCWWCEGHRWNTRCVRGHKIPHLLFIQQRMHIYIPNPTESNRYIYIYIRYDVTQHRNYGPSKSIESWLAKHPPFPTPKKLTNWNFQVASLNSFFQQVFFDKTVHHSEFVFDSQAFVVHVKTTGLQRFQHSTMMPFSRQGQLLKLLNQKDANWWFSFIHGRMKKLWHMWPDQIWHKQLHLDPCCSPWTVDALNC